MKYLNDNISFVLPAPSEDRYVEYTVYMVAIRLDSYPQFKTVFKGSVFCKRGEQKRVYLNDIVNSISYGYEGMDATALINDEREGLGDVETVQPLNYYYQLQVTCNLDPDWIEFIYVTSCHKDVRSPILKELVINASFPQMFSVTEFRSTVLPRVPAIKKVDNHFFFAPTIALNTKYYENAKFTEGPQKGKAGLYFSAVDGGSGYAASPFMIIIEQPIICTRIYGKAYANLTRFDSSKYIVATDKSINQGPIAKNAQHIAEIEHCPSEYYLIWTDRTGGYQCQPFSKKNTRTETFNRQNIITFDERERPYLTRVSNSWTLNSDWLSYDEYKCYESLFVSPKTYLYDTAYDELHEVRCTLDNWIEKNKENNNKLINLTVTVKDTSTENILS